MRNDKKLTLLGHLRELRTRLIRSVIVIVVTTAISFMFAKQIFDILTFKSALTKPIFDFLANNMHLFSPPTINLITIEITEMLGTYMKVCLVSGIILAIPYITYELVMFVSPALNTKEKRMFIYPALPWVGIMFLTGVAFAYFILLPPAFRFLTTFGSDIVTLQFRVGNYISIVSRMLLAIGLVFEMPVLTTILARMGIITSKWMAKMRKPAVVIAFVVGAAITPTFDPINQSLVAIPLIALWELSIWLAKLVEARKLRDAVADASPDIETG
jgi:sec-independent protein translocase protein TatC